MASKTENGGGHRDNLFSPGTGRLRKAAGVVFLILAVVVIYWLYKKGREEQDKEGGGPITPPTSPAPPPLNYSIHKTFSKPGVNNYTYTLDRPSRVQFVTGQVTASGGECKVSVVLTNGKVEEIGKFCLKGYHNNAETVQFSLSVNYSNVKAIHFYSRAKHAWQSCGIQGFNPATLFNSGKMRAVNGEWY